MNHFRQICKSLFFLFLLGALLLVSCGKNKPGPDSGGSQEPLDLQISIKTAFTCGAGDEITFSFYNGKGPVASDAVVLKGSGGTEHVCRISRVGSGDFSFVIPDGLVSGDYVFVIRRGSLSKSFGQVAVTVEQRIPVDKKEGFNVYGIVTCGETGMPGVVVSDGEEVTVTDKNGIYYIRSTKKYGHVFLSIPSGYEVASQGILPSFHQKLNASVSVYDRKDFELHKTGSDNYTVYILGDMHLANRTKDLVQFREYARDLNETIAATPGKEYVLTLGDMTWDAYWYDNNFQFKDYLAEMNRNFSGIPFFHTMGNHDNDYLKIGDFEKEWAYRVDLGPTFYSFNLGQVHYIVLDDIDYNQTGAGKDLRYLYSLDIVSDQLAWLAKDLSHVGKDTPIVLSMHAPLFMPTGPTTWRNNLAGADAGEANTDDLIAALRGYTVHVFTGHTHKIFGRDLLEEWNLFEHNGGAVCADWWWSGSLTPGVLVSTDGSPSGYTVWTVKGKEVSWRYKSACFPAEHQFRSYDMNEVRKVVTPELGAGRSGWTGTYVAAVNAYKQNEVLLNVWNYDKGWSVEVKEDGNPLQVTPVSEYDPLHMIAYDAPRFKVTEKPSFPTVRWNHFFKATASSPDSDLEICVTDRFGHVYTETMVRPKSFSTAAYSRK